MMFVEILGLATQQLINPLQAITIHSF